MCKDSEARGSMAPSGQGSLGLLEYGEGWGSESRSLDLDGRPGKNITWRQGRMIDRAVALDFSCFS